MMLMIFRQSAYLAYLSRVDFEYDQVIEWTGITFHSVAGREVRFSGWPPRQRTGIGRWRLLQRGGGNCHIN